MRKLLSALLACLLLCGLGGCSSPNSLQMDLYQGYGKHTKLIHLNASSGENRNRMESFAQTLTSAQPLEKEFSMFAYYPDYQLELAGKELVVSDGETSGFSIRDVSGQNGATLTVVIDLNGDYVDFYFPGPAPEASQTIYRSEMESAEFKKLVHYT